MERSGRPKGEAEERSDDGRTEVRTTGSSVVRAEVSAGKVDAVVIGAGHNGLAAATLLGREGQSVLVLERRDDVGGLCAGLPFHPGYRHTGIHHDTCVPKAIVDALRLMEHGLVTRPAPAVWCAAPGGGVLLEPGELLAAGCGPGWEQLQSFVEQVGPFLRRLASEPVPRLDAHAPAWPLLERAVQLRRLGQANVLELLRLVGASADDWLTPLLPDPRVRAAVALPGLLYAFVGVRDPQSAALVLRDLALAGTDEVVGGPAGLVSALLAAARVHRVEVRTGAEVERLVVERGAVRGVFLRGGERIDAERVVSSADPRRTVLDLAPPLSVPAGIEDEFRRFRTRSVQAKLHLALSAPPVLAGRTGPVERFRVVPSPEVLQDAFDAARLGRVPATPALDVRVPSLADPSIAPAGHAVLSVQIYGAPPEPTEGWSRAVRKQLVEATLSALAGVCPSIADTVVASELVVSAEIEARYGVTGGHPMHGEIALDQLWAGRPGPSSSRDRSPIPGLFLASSGTHPGGGATAVPGVLAARAVLGAS
jgi:phytoene dehydrogenase-like protein